MPPLKRALILIAVGFALLFCSPLGISLVYGLQTWPLAPFLVPFLSPGTSFLQMMVWGVSLFAFPLALICALLRALPKRQWPLYALGCIWIGSFLLFRPPPRNFWPLRRAGLGISVAQLGVLPPALERFRRSEGKYPAQLSELVPRYLPQIPETGMVAYPKLHYRRGGARNRLPRYELQVHTFVGMSFDALYYRPDGYEFLRDSSVERTSVERTSVERTSVERIGAWAYLHE